MQQGLRCILSLCSSANHESDFSTFHTNIIRKTGAKGGQKPGCAITLSLGAFHVDMQQLKVDFPSLFTKATVVVRKLGFPDVILPGMASSCVADPLTVAVRVQVY